jgi:adenylyl-sulfate kinase
MARGRLGYRREVTDRRATNVSWQVTAVDLAHRERLNGHKAAVLWFTGLSASGKTTLANLVDQQLVAAGVHACLLDGDNLRHGLNANLGFSADDRAENVRRIAECSRLFFDAGLITLVAVISPTQADRDLVRARYPAGRFVEIHVDTPLGVCEERDPRGLYRKARDGQIPEFTGVTSPYETPREPELRLDGSGDAMQQAERVLAWLRAHEIIPAR